MSEENKEISRRVPEEAFNRGNLGIVDELVAPDFENHDPAAGDIPPGPEGLKQFINIYKTAFPDVKITIEDQIAEGDRVATRWSARGTHQAELMGIPASGKETRVTGISIDRIKGGKIAESWNNWDTLGLLQQLGAIPEMEQARR